MLGNSVPQKKTESKNERTQKRRVELPYETKAMMKKDKNSQSNKDILSPDLN